MPEQKIDDFVAFKTFTKKGVEFDIGGKPFIMKPLVPKKLKILFQLMEESGKEMTQFKDAKNIIEFLIDKIVVIFPILFDAEINQDFADENISIPLCMEIWENFVKLNRLEGLLPFFQKLIKITKEDKVIPIKELKN